MTKPVILKEIAFEKECSLKKAAEIYTKYKASGKLNELMERLKNHKEV